MANGITLHGRGISISQAVLRRTSACISTTCCNGCSDRCNKTSCIKISNSVQFITHDGGTWTIRKDGGCHSLVKYGRIVVDENTFIGAHSIILPNVYIGKNVVVGAGSVVTKSIPDNCVVAGVPAKVIMSINEYKMKSLSKMPSDWSDEQYFKNKRSYLEKRIPYPPKVDNQ